MIIIGIGLFCVGAWAASVRNWLAWPIIAISLVLIVVPVRAHDHANAGLDPWYKSLSSRGGGPCCGGPNVDADAVNDGDWEVRGGHYWIRYRGTWMEVPDAMVLTQPNFAGRTLVWMFYVNGEPKIRCFIPGSMT